MRRSDAPAKAWHTPPLAASHLPRISFYFKALQAPPPPSRRARLYEIEHACNAMMQPWWDAGRYCAVATGSTGSAASRHAAQPPVSARARGQPASLSSRATRALVFSSIQAQ